MLSRIFRLKRIELVIKRREIFPGHSKHVQNKIKDMQLDRNIPCKESDKFGVATERILVSAKGLAKWKVGSLETTESSSQHIRT
jgi:hypothetical protein